MKKIYNEFFYIPKHEKIREKVMTTRVVMSGLLILVYLIAMSITAYAYFSYNVTSGSNIIKSANFEADVLIVADGEEIPVNVNKVGEREHSAELEKGETYFVTLKKGDNSTAKTGFCVITANYCKETYHTQQIGVDETVETGVTESVTFKLTVSDNTTVKILSHWGTSSSYDKYKNNTDNEELYILDDDSVNMEVAKLEEPSGEDEQEEENTMEDSAISPTETEPEQTATPTESSGGSITSETSYEPIDSTETTETNDLSKELSTEPMEEN